MSRTKINLNVRESYNAGITPDTRVDYEKGIIFDVELMGPESQNRKKYLPEAIQDASAAVPTAGSYIDHPSTESNNRSIRERFGVFKEGYINSAGRLCAREFHYDKANSFAPSFEWMLKHCPRDIGFSINAEAIGYFDPISGQTVVTNIGEVHGFDLVDRPATTNGIFAIRESYNSRIKSFSVREANKTMFPEAFKVGVNELVVALTDGTIDVPGAKKKMNDLMKLITPEGEKPAETDLKVEMEAEEAYKSASDDTKEMKVLEQASKSRFGFVKFLANQLDAMKVREQAAADAKRKEQTLTARLEKAKAKFAGVPGADKAFTATFREQLSNAKDDKEAEALIDDRLTIFNVREQASDGTRFETPHSAEGGKPVEVSDLVKTLFG